MKANRPTSIDDFVPSLRKLSNLLGLKRHTVSEYFRKPGAPQKHGKKGYSIEEARLFIEQSVDSDRTRRKVDGEFKELKHREVLARCKKIEFEFDVERGKFFPKAEMEQDARAAVAVFRQVFGPLPSQLGAPFGDIGPEIEKQAEAIIEDAIVRAGQAFRVLAGE